jgi:hypothetical protein
VCFISELDLAVDELIQITLPMPEEVTGVPEKMQRFTGRVAYVNPIGNRQHSIGVKFIYSERV